MPALATFHRFIHTTDELLLWYGLFKTPPSLKSRLAKDGTLSRTCFSQATVRRDLSRISPCLRVNIRRNCVLLRLTVCHRFIRAVDGPPHGMLAKGGERCGADGESWGLFYGKAGRAAAQVLFSDRNGIGRLAVWQAQP